MECLNTILDFEYFLLKNLSWKLVNFKYIIFIHCKIKQILYFLFIEKILIKFNNLNKIYLKLNKILIISNNIKLIFNFT